MIHKQKISKDVAIPKVKHFCAYQERCYAEVKEKLYSFGLYKNEIEEILSILIEENYLNEQRFAIAFAGGKFRQNKWGKIKIAYSLKQKQVSANCIKKALQQIDETHYLKTLEKLFDDKLKTLNNDKNIFTNRKKVQDYLLQKGYETNIVTAFTSKI